MTKTKLERAYRKAAVKALIKEEENLGLLSIINGSVTIEKEKGSASNTPLEDKTPPTKERNHHG